MKECRLCPGKTCTDIDDGYRTMIEMHPYPNVHLVYSGIEKCWVYRKKKDMEGNAFGGFTMSGDVNDNKGKSV